MMTLDSVSKTFNRTWESVSQGWNHLVQRASNALIPFHSKKEEDHGAAGITRWGLLSADIYDDDDKLVISLEAPGMSADDFDITVLDNRLYIKGEKHFTREASKGDYTLKERAYGRFERVLPLGYKVDPDSARAAYKRGVLHIEINKAEQHKRRKIQLA